MKFTLATMMLLVSTLSFAQTTYTYEGVSPLQAKACNVELTIQENGDMDAFHITGPYESKVLFSEIEPIYKVKTLGTTFNDMFHEYVANGLAQTPTINSKRMLYKLKDFTGKYEIDLRGNSIGELNSASYKVSDSRFEYETSTCVNLKLSSVL